MVLTLLLLLATTAPELPTYRSKRVVTPIFIDGKLDEWNRIPPTRDFVTLRTSEQPTLRTEAKLCTDDRFLYIAAEMSDPDVRATIREHDGKLHSETAFEVFIDPDGDGADYIELQVNPLNTTLDLKMNKPYSAGGKADASFTLRNWQTAVRIQGTLNDSADRDEGWTVEMAIPLDEIDATRRPPWRMNLARAWREPSDSKTSYSTWSPIGQANLHVPERFGRLHFSN